MVGTTFKNLAAIVYFTMSGRRVVRSRSVHSDSSGQSSLDFLTGISIFLITFTYLVVQVPTIFAPFQTESTDLQPVAYRTCMILAEDTGWWNGTTGSGPDWENATAVKLNDTCRIGLSANKHNPNDVSELMNRGKVCILNEDKIKRLNLIYHSGGIATHGDKDYAVHDWIRYLLGLDIIRSYSYNISLQYLNGTTAEPMFIPNNTCPVLCIGERIPETVEVEKVERLVAVEGACGIGDLQANATTNTSNRTLTLPKLNSFMVSVNSSDFTDENMTANARLNVVPNNCTNLSINKSGLFVGGWHIFNRTMIDSLNDTNNIEINVSWCNVSYMWVNRSDWGDYVGDVLMPSAKLVVCIW